MNIDRIRDFFAPAPHVDRLPAAEVKRRYPPLRWAILEATFIGYSVFYLVRVNLGQVSDELESTFGITNTKYGLIVAATSIAYGLGKFLLGSLSDRSNPRRFMPAGLVLTAFCNFAFAGVAGLGLDGDLLFILFGAIWTLNGFFQGAGWPPCGRSIGHWYSVRERGTLFAIWNISHNVGGGLAGVIAANSAHSLGFEYAFIVPGGIALLTAAYLALRLRDTPQSVGLPPVEEYRNDHPPDEDRDHERELGTREIFVDYILYNKYLWLFAIANLFVYVLRYSMLDYGPKYLAVTKNVDKAGMGMAQLILEWGGIPSTLLFGWLSDRLGGRRGMVSLLCTVPIIAAFVGLRMNQAGPVWLDLVLMGSIGFFVYPPVMLLGVAALDVTSKKAVGAAAGFVGLFGYAGRSLQALGLGVIADSPAGWDGVMLAIIGAGFVAVLLLSFTWRIRPRG